jgi:hypothetical protein
VGIDDRGVLPAHEPALTRWRAIWAGYDIVGVEDDLSAYGLLKADEHESEARGVTTFVRVEPDDHTMYAKLGIERK